MRIDNETLWALFVIYVFGPFVPAILFGIALVAFYSVVILTIKIVNWRWERRNAKYRPK